MNSRPPLLVLPLVSLLMGAALLMAQAPASPAFEVASIKPNTSGRAASGSTFLPGGRYVGTRVSLKNLILLAFGAASPRGSRTLGVYLPLLSIQIEGGPAWLNTETFDVEAQAQGNPTTDALRLMLRTLLAERFKLAVHPEQRNAAIFALVTARSDGKPGPQFQPSAVDCSADAGAAPPPPPSSEPMSLKPPNCGFRIAASSAGVLTMTGNGITTSQLAAELSSFGPVGRIVLDRTGLTGGFDVTLRATSDRPRTDAPGDAPSIFTALQEQLGLKLESTRGPVDVLVIDHVERPTPD